MCRRVLGVSVDGMGAMLEVLWTTGRPAGKETHNITSVFIFILFTEIKCNEEKHGQRSRKRISRWYPQYILTISCCIYMFSPYFPGAGSNTKKCLSDDEMRQTRICNQVPCMTYVWQTTAWSECVRTDNTSAPCGEGTGSRHRTVLCERDPGKGSFA